MDSLYDIAFLFVALFALGFTIFIHELGHFLAARRRGLIITRFSIGFGPKILAGPAMAWNTVSPSFPSVAMLPASVGRHGQTGRQRRQPRQDPEKVETTDIQAAWKDFEEEENKEEAPPPIPKISYADKMIVSVMGAVFNVLLAFALSSILWFFGYDVSDAQLTTKVGYVADTVERWNPLVGEGEGNRPR